MATLVCRGQSRKMVSIEHGSRLESSEVVAQRDSRNAERDPRALLLPYKTSEAGQP